MKIDLNTSLKNNKHENSLTKNELQTFFQIKQDLVERMFKRNMEQYDKYCDDYEENEDAETLANIEKYEDRLKYFIKK